MNPNEITDIIDEEAMQMHPDRAPLGEPDQEEAHFYLGTNPNPYASIENPKYI